MRKEEVINELTQYCGFTVEAARRLVANYPYPDKLENCKSVVRMCDSVIAAERIVRGMVEDDDFFPEELE